MSYNIHRFGRKIAVTCLLVAMLVFTTTAQFSWSAKAETPLNKGMEHSAPSPKKAMPAQTGTIRISGAWARVSFGRAVNSAGFMSLKNSGAHDDLLISANSPISKMTQLHTHIKDGDVMRMRRVKGGIKIAKGTDLEFKPGGLHVMFIGLKQTLKAGTKFPLTLHFKRAGALTITMSAQKMAAPKGPHKRGSEKMDHGMMDHSKMNH